LLVDDCIIASTAEVKFSETKYAKVNGKGAKMLKKLMNYEN